MTFFETIRQKAASVGLLDIFGDNIQSPALTRDEQFKLDYALPHMEKILDDTNADVSIISPYKNLKHSKKNENDQEMLYVYSGRLFLTTSFLIFRDSFDHNLCVFTLNISTIKKVERTSANSYTFTLQITLYSGIKIIVQFIGLKYRSMQFSQKLKFQLKKNIDNSRLLDSFVDTCYSEYLIAKNILKKGNSLPPSGLGQIFEYPGDPILQRERAKLKLWFDYFKDNGKNLTIIKHPMFYKLIRVGIPNRLKGEIWELCIGSMYLRFANQGMYLNILNENKNKQSQALEEIEKDLNRSLPEYPAYQHEEGINRLRNVLVAYSWKNPDVGYCQAMNIVVAGLLIFMTEEQAFWCLSNLCDNYVPGYYSKTMYGTLLDQKVFESFIQSKIPVLWDHIVQYDIQISVVSLPWFLSLFLTSMPLIYAFRILDIFFLNGPKTLFQVGLAVLKINGENLLQIEDDGTFIALIKSFFHNLDQSAHPDSSDIKYKKITKFQELLVVSFNEFSIITDEMVTQERNKFKKIILHDIESFAKRTQLRNLPQVRNINQEELSIVYDIFYQSIETHKISMGTGSSNMDFNTFVQFLSKFCDWCKSSESDQIPRFRKQKTDFLKRLFKKWDLENTGELTLQNIILGLDNLMSHDLMLSINNFFTLYDQEGKGEIHREEILQMSEGLLFLTDPWKSGRCIDKLTQQLIENDIADLIVKENDGIVTSAYDIELPKGVVIDDKKYKHEQMERYLKAASNFLQLSFEYARPLEAPNNIDLIDLSDNKESTDANIKAWRVLTANVALDPEHPCVVDLATFRMIILADETYELFFSSTLRHSFNIEKQDSLINGKSKALKNVFDGLIADGRRVAYQVRRRVDSVTTRGSITSIPSEKQDELDDFTSEHMDEQSELLERDLIDLSIDPHNHRTTEHYKRMEQSVITEKNKSTMELIEFEA